MFEDFVLEEDNIEFFLVRMILYEENVGKMRFKIFL